MSLDPNHVLTRAQTAARALMIDTIVVRRKVGENTNPDTGVVTPTWATVYAGPGKIQQRTGVSRPQNVGEAEVFIARLEVHVPVTVTGIATDDVVTVSASVRDQDLLTRVFHVRELGHKTYPSARRYSIVEVTS